MKDTLIKNFSYAYIDYGIVISTLKMLHHFSKSHHLKITSFYTPMNSSEASIARSIELGLHIWSLQRP